tara:strand:+ start:316 stop:1497 length:1182 start_codon:yes stop_codon:yes gene_type:complete
MWQKNALDERELQVGHQIITTLSDVLSDTELFPGTSRFRASKKFAGITGVDLESGLVEIQISDQKSTKMKFGKYLHGRGFDADTCREASSRLRASVEMVKGAKLLFTENGDEAVDVYKNGPYSCMAHCESIRAYDSVDICVAYVKIDDRIVARTLVSCNQEEKIWMSIYGNNDIIRPLLDAAGYVSGSFQGLTIAAIEHRDSYYAPYRDDDLGYIVAGDRMVISCRGDGGQSTDGVLGRSCERCGEVGHEDEMYWSDYHEEQMCLDCHSDLHVYVDYLGDSVATEDENIVCINHDYYHVEDYETICYSEYECHWILREDATFSDYDEDYFLTYDVVEAITKLDGEPEICHPSNCVQLENEEGEEVWVHDDIASDYEEWVIEHIKQLKLEFAES